jgi:hypothetical protein
MVVSRGFVAVLPPLALTNVKGGGDGEEGAIDEQPAGCNDNGAHYDMHWIGHANPVNATNRCICRHKRSGGLQGGYIGSEKRGETVVFGGAIAVLPPLGLTNVKGRRDGEEGAIDEQTAG